MPESKLSNPGLPLEETLRNQIYNALQGDMIEDILKIAKVRKTENYWRYMLEGHSFKVDESMSPKLFGIFTEVKDKLGFTEKVDFYISNNAEVNAFALSSFEEDEPNIININSSLLNLMSDDELRFIVGHEIGHLINKNAALMKLIQFVFPNPESVPPILYHKIRLWNQLSELIADRYGFMACPNREVCISSFFKMSSGIDAHRVELNMQAFLAENEKRLDFFKSDSGLNIASHPINPIRVKAIDLFSRSEYFSTGGEALSEQDMQKEMDELTEVLLKIKSSKLDYLRSYFIASAGLVCANIDGEVDQMEIEKLMIYLSEFCVFPRSFLDTIYESGKVSEIISDVVSQILNINPAERENMIVFLINMVMADKNINEKELKFLFDVGQNIFGYSQKEVAQIFSNVIQGQFVPAVKDLF